MKFHVNLVKTVDDSYDIEIEELPEIKEIPEEEYMPEIDEETLDLICSLIKVEEGDVKPTSDTLTLGHLFGGFDFDGVVLGDLLKDMDEETKKITDGNVYYLS